MPYTVSALPGAPLPQPIPQAAHCSPPPLPRVVSMDPFQTERRVFDAHLNDLLACSEGQFVAIHGTEILGTSATFEGAVELGFTRTGQRAFLVRRIAATPTPLIVPARVA